MGREHFPKEMGTELGLKVSVGSEWGGWKYRPPWGRDLRKRWGGFTHVTTEWSCPSEWRENWYPGEEEEETQAG